MSGDGERGHLATARGDPREQRRRPGAEHDDVTAAPGAASRQAGGVADGLYSAVGNVKRFNLPSAKKAIARLSGDQNGMNALSVPASGRDVNESSRRSQSCERRGLVGGDEDELSAIGRNRSAAGAVGASDAACRTEGAVVGRVDLKAYDRRSAVIRVADVRERTRESSDEQRPRDSSAVTKSRPGRRRRERRISFSSRSSRTSAMSCVRRCGSFSRQRRNTRRMGPRRIHRQRGPVRLALQDVRQRVRHVVAVERAPAGQHLVEHGAKRPDVAALVGGPAARLLGAHIRGGAEDDAACVSAGLVIVGRLRSRCRVDRRHRSGLWRDRNRAPSRCRPDGA